MRIVSAKGVRRLWKEETAKAGTNWKRLPNNMISLLEDMLRFHIRTYAHRKPKKMKAKR